MASLIKNLIIGDNSNWTVAKETYFSLVDNPFVQTQYSPTATFSVNINRATYINIRRLLTMGSMVPLYGVRIEEIFNNFDIKSKEPEDSRVFNCSLELSSSRERKTSITLPEYFRPTIRLETIGTE